MELTTHTVTTPPRDAATVVLLRDAPAGLEVFLLRRAGASDVLGGAYVFPGGKVDASDAELGQDIALDTPPAQLALALSESDLSHAQAAGMFIAALREAFEECGVWFGEPPDGVDAGADFQHLVRRNPSPLRVSALQPWTRWITPRQASMMNKRFDTRFFLAALPAGQTPVHDDHEATASVWLSPRAALEAYWRHEIEFAPPQIMSLAQLARHADVASAMREAAQRPPPVIEPHPFDHHGQRVICYPGDPTHPQATRVMPGPTRVVYARRRFEPPHGTLAELLPP